MFEVGPFVACRHCLVLYCVKMSRSLFPEPGKDNNCSDKSATFKRHQLCLEPCSNDFWSHSPSPVSPPHIRWFRSSYHYKSSPQRATRAIKSISQSESLKKCGYLFCLHLKSVLLSFKRHAAAARWLENSTLEKATVLWNSSTGKEYGSRSVPRFCLVRFFTHTTPSPGRAVRYLVRTQGPRADSVGCRLAFS
jgi:hypothetical protein